MEEFEKSQQETKGEKVIAVEAPLDQIRSEETL